MNKISESIYNDIRTAIINNRYSIGDKLPSIRHLASYYNVNNYKVSCAYDELVLHGYIKSKQGYGYFVEGSFGRYNNLNETNYRILACNTISPTIRSFYKNKIYMECLNNLMSHGLKNLYYTNLNSFYYSDSGLGNPKLRKILSMYLKRIYNLNVSPDQIIISSSKNHLLRYLMTEYSKDFLVLDEFVDFYKYDILNFNNQKIRKYKLNQEGIIIDSLPKTPCIIYLESYDHFPTGISHSSDRIDQLKNYCLNNNIFLVENLSRKELVYEKQKFLYEENNTFLIDDLSSFFPTSIKFSYLVFPKKIKISNFKNEVSSFTENFIINCFDNNYFYKISDKMWYTQKINKDIISTELIKRGYDFCCTSSGSHISISIKDKQQLTDTMNRITNLPFEICPQVYLINNNLFKLTFEYINIDVNKIPQFLDYILYGTL